MFGTYECENCGSCKEYEKAHGTEWPEVMYCLFCEESSMKKTLSVSGISVPAGKLDNASNEYTNTR